MSMNRDDFWGILGSGLLFGMAYYDTGWCWFWAIAGAAILLWTCYTAFFASRTD